MTNEDIIKGLTLMRKNFDSNSVYGSYCIDFLDAAIEALKEQPEHSKNTSSKQPDLDTLGIKTGETCADAISRRAAIDALAKRWGWIMNFDRIGETIAEECKTVINGLPSVQPERKKWKWSFIGDNMFECTCCGTPYTTQQLNGLRNYNTDPYAPKFCPNCGADMRGESDED